jgi:hypothetical protein
VDDLITMAIPGVISDDERRELLHQAALACASEGSAEAAVTLLRYAHESLDEYEIERACTVYVLAIQTGDDLASNPGCWRDHYPDLDGDQEAAAQQLAADDVTEAMNVLMFGSSAR